MDAPLQLLGPSESSDLAALCGNVSDWIGLQSDEVVSLMAKMHQAHLELMAS